MERQLFARVQVCDGLALVGQEARCFYLRSGKDRAVRMIEAAAERASQQQDGVALRCVPERELRVREILFDGVALDARGPCFAPAPVLQHRAVRVANQQRRREPRPAAGIDAVVDDPSSASAKAHTGAGVYNLNGQLVRPGTSLDGLPKGIYIVNGKKVKK